MNGKLKQLAALWLLAGCVDAAMATKPPSPTPPPPPAPVANTESSVTSVGAIGATSDYHSGTVQWTLPKGEPVGSYDVATDFYDFSLAGLEKVTASATIPGADDQKTWSLTGNEGELLLYKGLYEQGTPLSSPAYSLQEQIAFDTDVSSLVDTLAKGDYFFVVEGTTDGSKGGKYSLDITAQDESVSEVSEPPNMALLLAGVGLLAVVARRRKVR